jgi:PAS domain S-box-containing protein
MNHQNLPTPTPTLRQRLGQTLALRHRLVLLLVCVLASMWLAVAWDGRKSGQDAQHQMRQQTTALAMAFADHTEATLQRGDHLLLQLRDDWLANPNTFAQSIARHQTLLGDTALQIAIIAADGTLVYSNLAFASGRVDLSDREHFKVHQAGGPADRLFVSRPVKGRVSGKWSIQLTRPIFDAGRFAGVVVLSLDPGYFVRYYQRFDLGAQGVITIVRDTGEVLARSVGQEKYIGKVINAAPVTDAGAPPTGTYHRSASQTDGVERIFGYYRLPQRGLSVRIGVGVDEFLAPIRAQQHATWLAAGVITLVLTGMAWLLLRGVARLQAAERALSKDKQSLTNILWGTGVGTWEWNVQTGETRFNERWAELIGYTLAELTPISIATWKKYAHLDDLMASGVALEKHFSGATETYECESRMLHKDGHWIWVLDRGRVTSWSNDGKPLWMAGTHMDITARKRAEEAIVELNRSFVALLENTSDFIYFKDQSSRFLFCSQTLADITGHASWRDMIGKHDLEVFPSDTAQIYHDEELPIFRDGVPLLDKVNPYYDAKGRTGWVSTNKWPLLDRDGKVVGLFGISRDVTARKQADATLAEKTRELLRSNAELEQFSYAVSHDLRQPLRMISSYLELLQTDLGDALDADKREYFNFAIDGAKRMDAMMLGLLEYSRVGRKGEPPVWLDTRAVLDEALLFLRPLIDEAQADLRIEGAWPRFFGSPDEMLRLLQNLLGNALKFRVAGRVPEITVRSEATSKEWQLCVSDNGVGIAPEQIARLFQVFQRLQSRAAFEGTGIGLALCRKIAEHHGGRIWAESPGEGQGSRFCVVLPLQQEQKVPT